MADGDKAKFIVELVEKIRGPANKASAAMGKLMGRMEKVRRQALSKTMETTREISTLGAIAAAAVAAGAIGAAISFTDFAQRSTLGLQQLAKHGASAEKLFNHVRNEAEQLGLDVKDTTKTFTKFLALQFNPKQATDLIRMGSDLQAFGATAEEIQRVFAQLGQIQAKGKLQGEELIVLAENGISTQLVYEQLGKTLGKTKDEILKMQQAGQLTSDVALPAIGEAVKAKLHIKEFGDAGRKIADSTLGGMTNRLKAQMQNSLTDVGKALEGPLTQLFKPLAEGLGGFIKDPANVQMLVSALSDAADAVKASLPFVKEFFNAFGAGFKEAAPEIFTAVGEALKFMGGSSGDSMNNMRLLGKTLGQVVAFGIGAGVVLGGLLLAAVQAVSAVVQMAIGAWGGFIETLGAAVFAVTDWWSNLMATLDSASVSVTDKALAIGRAIVEGIVHGIVGLASLPVQAISNMVGGALAAAKRELGIKSPSTEFEFIGQMTTAGLVKGLEPMQKAFANAMPANTNFRAPEVQAGPMASSFAETPRWFDMPQSGGSVVHIDFSPVFQVTQQAGQSASELVDELEGRVRRTVEEMTDELAAAVGA